MEVLVTDGGPLYSSHNFKKNMEKKGIKHHLCALENPMVNGFVEVFQKVPLRWCTPQSPRRRTPGG